MKNSSNGWIGFRQFIIAGVAAPILLNIILAALGFTIFPGIIELSKIAFGPSIISLIGILLGAWYAARYLMKTFVISDSSKVVLISTVWFGIFEILLTFYPYLTGSVVENVAMQAVSILILIIAFYVSNKYFLASKPSLNVA